MRKKVLITTSLPGASESLFDESFDLKQNLGDPLSAHDLLLQAEDRDAVICDLADQITDQFLAKCPNLKLVANVAVGVDNIDIEAANRRSILIANTPGVLDDTTADLTFALLLALARRLNDAELYLRDGKWKKFSLDLLFGVDVHHKTLGIIGCGRIGQAVARRARGFSMNILYSQRTRLSPKQEEELGLKYVGLDELLSSSDFVSLHCPHNKETFHLLGEREFALMKEGCQLINASRGPVIDEPALIRALKSGKLAGAGLDVFENEPKVPSDLLELNNVVLVPHIGSATKETRCAMARLATEAVIKAFAGTKPDNLVNPESWSGFIERKKMQGN